jgi:hypothetical protein
MKDERMQYNSTGGFILGATTGMIQFFLQINNAFGERLIEAAITALISGACGMAGTYLIGLVIKKFKQNKDEKISK